MASFDLLRHRRPLALAGLVDLIVVVATDHRAIGRDLDDRELVDLHELRRLGQRRPGHARELVVHAEVVLQRDRRERLVLLLDAHALLRLDRLVEPLRPATTLEDATGELIDDLHLVVDHRVVDVALVQRLGLQRLDQVVDEVAVLRAVEVVDAEEALGLGHAALGDGDRLMLLVELVVEVGDELLLHPRVHSVGRVAGLELRGEAGEFRIQVARLLRRARDDQRGSRLVDQDVVYLVDDRERVVWRLALLGLRATAVLDLLLQRRRHVVAQVVEAELRVRPVGDIGGVGRALVLVGLHVLEHADVDSERVVDRLHPHRVAAGEVVVDRDDVHAPASKGVERDGERRGQGLPLARLHLGDRAVVEHHAADELDVEVAHPHRALAGLAHEREALVEKLLELLAVASPLAQRVGGLPKLGVGVVLHLGLKGVDPTNPLLVGLELLRFAHAKRAVQERHRVRVAAGLPRSWPIPRKIRTTRPARCLRRSGAGQRSATRGACGACRDGA